MRVVLKFLAMSILALSLSSYEVAYAHGGRTAADGCHMDRKAGARHCHGKKKRADPKRTSTGKVYYKNCTAARAAGVTPIRRGEPGYASHLDRDNDGIACE